MTTAQTAPNAGTTIPDAPADYVHQGLVPVEYTVGNNGDSERDIQARVEQAMQKFKQEQCVGLIFGLQRFWHTSSGNSRNVRLEIHFCYVRVQDLKAYAESLQELSPSLLLRLLVGS